MNVFKKVALSLAAATMVGVGAVAVTPPPEAAAVNSFVKNTSSDGLRISIDDSCHSPESIPPGYERVLNCDHRRVWVNNGYCVQIKRDGLDLTNYCAYDGGFWGYFKYGVIVHIARFKHY